MYKKLSNVKRFIEDLSLRNSNYGNLYIEEGSGREVIIYDDYAIKMPLGDYNIATNGCNQNLKELEVWLNTKHPYLVPIYGVHMGCLISKKVEADLDYVSEKYNLTREDIDNKIKQRLPEVIAIAKEFDLHIGDISKTRSWGYDEDLGFVCLDYGFVDYSKDALKKSISRQEDEVLLKAYEYLSCIITSECFNTVNSIRDMSRCDCSLKDIFGNQLYFNLDLCKIAMDELVKRNLASYTKDISLIQSKIFNEFSTEDEFNSKILDYYGLKRLHINTLNIDIIIKSNTYEDSINEILNKTEKYCNYQAFLLKTE